MIKIRLGTLEHPRQALNPHILQELEIDSTKSPKRANPSAYGPKKNKESQNLFVDVRKLAIVLELALGDVLELGSVRNNLILDVLERISLATGADSTNSLSLSMICRLLRLFRRLRSFLDNTELLSTLLLNSPARAQRGHLDLVGSPFSKIKSTFANLAATKRQMDNQCGKVSINS